MECLRLWYIPHLAPEATGLHLDANAEKPW
jgi:hypothetical protein